MKIFLLGLPGCGKTTLGKELAEALHVPFVDLDAEIEKREEMPVREIFRTKKEEYFRRRESIELEQWCQSGRDFVMATGGGAPVFFDNIDKINGAGTSIFLDVSAKEIANRIMLTPLEERPLFANANRETLKDQIEFMRSQRLHFYNRAHLILTGDSISITEMIDKIRKEIRP
ncbi:MAG TPA: shikimate kinase [Cyclobacteriaceae bacterium]|nr:shikimate kinase [Cyclobacteriaceae bacterium]